MYPSSSQPAPTSRMSSLFNPEACSRSSTPSKMWQSSSMPSCSQDNLLRHTRQTALFPPQGHGISLKDASLLSSADVAWTAKLYWLNKDSSHSMKSSVHAETLLNGSWCSICGFEAGTIVLGCQYHFVLLWCIACERAGPPWNMKRKKKRTRCTRCYQPFCDNNSFVNILIYTLLFLSCTHDPRNNLVEDQVLIPYTLWQQ